MPNEIASRGSSEPSTLSSAYALLDTLRFLYPDLTFRPGKKFKFRPKKTIYYLPPETSPETFPLLLCHELAHALLGHFSYLTDLERLKIEVAAWEETKNLCEKFEIPFSSEFANLELDTYRDWLNQKSLCKTCGMTRFETPDGNYHCPRCDLLKA